MATTPCPLSPEKLAAREWPALRARLIDVAAALDRLETAGGAETRTVRDQAESLLQAILDQNGGANRAERLLSFLSRGYDPSWQKRFAAGQTLADPPSESASEAS